MSKKFSNLKNRATSVVVRADEASETPVTYTKFVSLDISKSLSDLITSHDIDGLYISAILKNINTGVSKTDFVDTVKIEISSGDDEDSLTRSFYILETRGVTTANLNSGDIKVEINGNKVTADGISIEKESAEKIKCVIDISYSSKITVLDERKINIVREDIDDNIVSYLIASYTQKGLQIPLSASLNIEDNGELLSTLADKTVEKTTINKGSQIILSNSKILENSELSSTSSGKIVIGENAILKICNAENVLHIPTDASIEISKDTTYVIDYEGTESKKMYDVSENVSTYTYRYVSLDKVIDFESKESNIVSNRTVVKNVKDISEKLDSKFLIDNEKFAAVNKNINSLDSETSTKFEELSDKISKLEETVKDISLNTSGTFSPEFESGTFDIKTAYYTIFKPVTVKKDDAEHGLKKGESFLVLVNTNGQTCLVSNIGDTKIEDGKPIDFTTSFEIVSEKTDSTGIETNEHNKGTLYTTVFSDDLEDDPFAVHSTYYKYASTGVAVSNICSIGTIAYKPDGTKFADPKGDKSIDGFITSDNTSITSSRTNLENTSVTPLTVDNTFVEYNAAAANAATKPRTTKTVGSKTTAETASVPNRSTIAVDYTLGTITTELINGKLYSNMNYELKFDSTPVKLINSAKRNDLGIEDNTIYTAYRCINACNLYIVKEKFASYDYLTKLPDSVPYPNLVMGDQGTTNANA